MGQTDSSCEGVGSMRLFISSKSETFILQNFPFILSFPPRSEYYLPLLPTKPTIAGGRGSDCCLTSSVSDPHCFQCEPDPEFYDNGDQDPDPGF